MTSLRLSVAREHAPEILHMSADMFYPNTMAARDFLGLALIVIILETHCCQAVKIKLLSCFGSSHEDSVTIAAEIRGTIAIAI